MNENWELQSSNDAISSTCSRQRTSELFPLAYDHLKRLAISHLARLRPGQTIQPTVLVHEAYIKLARNTDSCWENKTHFFSAAAQAMREVLVDRLRQKSSVKRGAGYHRIGLEDCPFASEINPDNPMLLHLETALQHLEKLDKRRATVVMLKFFAGLDHTEVASCLDMSVRTVEREWSFARVWLHREIELFIESDE